MEERYEATFWIVIKASDKTEALEIAKRYCSEKGGEHKIEHIELMQILETKEE